MKKEDIAYCGLDCALCEMRFSDIRVKSGILNEAFEKVNMIDQMISPKLFLEVKCYGYLYSQYC